jgi:membrane associated rhomboid family serine protease
VIIPPLAIIYLFCCYWFAAIGLKDGWIDHLTRFITLEIAIFGSIFAFLGGAAYGFLFSLIGNLNSDYE